MTEAQKTTIEIQELYWKHDAVQNPVHAAVVVEAGDALLATRHFIITPTGLRVIGEPTLNDCRDFAKGLGGISGAINLSIGDLLNYTEIRYGETYAQLEDDLHIKADQLQNFKWVSSRVPLEWRSRFSEINENHHAPSFTLCKHVASISDEKVRHDLFVSAAMSNWNSERVKAEVDIVNDKPAPALADYVARAIAPLQHAAEAYPSDRAWLHKMIAQLERKL